jgi:hypothetical protein
MNAVADSVTGVPPAAGIVRRRPSAMNPSVVESGDQNGDEAPSVPAIG